MSAEGQHLLGRPQQPHDLRGCDPVEGLATLRPVDDQTAILEAGKVARDVCLRAANSGVKVGDPKLLVSELAQDGKPGLVREPAEQLRGQGRGVRS